MAESEGIQEIVNQVAIQVVTAVMMVLKEPQRQRHGGIVLEKHVFNGNAQDRQIELFNFVIEVTNIFDTKAYELTDEKKVPVMKNWLGREGLQLKKYIYK